MQLWFSPVGDATAGRELEYAVLRLDHAAKVSWSDSMNGCLPTCVWSPSEKSSASGCLAAMVAVGARETLGDVSCHPVACGPWPDNVGTSGRKLEINVDCGAADDRMQMLFPDGWGACFSHPDQSIACLTSIQWSYRLLRGRDARLNHCGFLLALPVFGRMGG